MNERTLIARERNNGPGGLGSLFDEPEPSPAQVRVSCGPFEEYFPFAGRPVGEVRRMLGPRFDIPPNGQAVVDGQDVQDDTVLREGQMLTFTHRVGEKGSRTAWMRRELPPRHRSQPWPLER